MVMATKNKALPGGRAFGGLADRSVLPDARSVQAREIADQSLDETFEKVLVSLVPTVVMAVMAATAISEAIRPYSMAVAPDSSLAKRAKRVFMGILRLTLFMFDVVS